jgi:hypothetical protein
VATLRAQEVKIPTISHLGLPTLNAPTIAKILYRDLGFKGASSHSGRRTFITKAARRCIEGGESLRHVQELAFEPGNAPRLV